MGKVLAYSKEASIDMANLNPEARYLFDSYRQVYEELGKNKGLTTRAETATKALMMCSLAEKQVGTGLSLQQADPICNGLCGYCGCTGDVLP